MQLLDVGLTLSLGTGNVEELVWWLRDCGWLAREGTQMGAHVSHGNMQGMQGIWLENSKAWGFRGQSGGEIRGRWMCLYRTTGGMDVVG